MAVRLALSLWLVLLVHFNPDGAAGARFVYLVRAIVEGHTFSVDAYAATSYGGLLSADIFTLHGHQWVDTNPGLAFLAAPAWAAVVALAHLLPGGSALLADPLAFLLAHFVTTATTTALFTVLASLLVAGWVRARTGSESRATLAAVVYAIGTNSFFLSGLLIQHSAIALVTLVLFLSVVEPGLVLPRTAPHRRRVLLGLAAGTGILVDLSVIPALAVLALPLLLARATGEPETSRQRRLLVNAAGFLAGAVVPLAVLLAYQAACFGNAFQPAQHYYFANGVAGGFATLPSVSVLLAVLFSLRAGLFVFVPVALCSIWVMASAERSEAAGRSARLLSVTLLAAYLLYASCFTASVEYGYFGPRYLAPVIPVLVGIAMIGLRRELHPVAIVTIAASFAINLFGAQNGIYVSDSLGAVRTVGLWLVRGPWLPAVDQLHADFGLGSATPYGFLALLAAVLLVVWFPWRREMPLPRES